MDTIFIKNLRLEMSIGITEPELAAKQSVIINLELGCDISKAVQSGDVSDTVNYYSVAKEIEALAPHRHFNLLEELAEEIAALCLDMGSVKVVTVKAEKPNIMSELCDSVGVKIERKA